MTPNYNFGQFQLKSRERGFEVRVRCHVGDAGVSLDHGDLGRLPTSPPSSRTAAVTPSKASLLDLSTFVTSA